MPLDRSHGEVIEGIDASMHIVIEPRHLAEMTNLVTNYQEKKLFGSVTRQRPIFDDAVAHAIDGFANAGALRPIRFNENDVLVQIYPKERMIAVVFQRKVAGEERYVTRFYHDIPQPVIESLLTRAGKRMPREH